MKQRRNKGATKKGEKKQQSKGREQQNKKAMKQRNAKKKTKKHNGVKQKLGLVHIQEPKKKHEASSSHYC
jgi:hypothetical protein